MFLVNAESEFRVTRGQLIKFREKAKQKMSEVADNSLLRWFWQPTWLQEHDARHIEIAAVPTTGHKIQSHLEKYNFIAVVVAVVALALVYIKIKDSGPSNR